MKRLLSVLLAVCLLVCAAHVFAGEYNAQDLSAGTFVPVENLEISSAVQSGTVTAITDADTGHGAGYTFSKTFDETENTFGDKILATMTLDTPVAITDKGNTIIEFWYKGNGANEKWAGSFMAINGEAIFGVNGSNSIGMGNGNSYLEWYRFNSTYTKDTWMKVRVFLKQGTYNPWNSVENVPATTIIPYVTLADGSNAEPWRRDGHCREITETINTISFGYRSDKTPTKANEDITKENTDNEAWNAENEGAQGYPKPTNTPLIETSGDFEFSIAGLRIYQDTSFTADGWYGYENLTKLNQWDSSSDKWYEQGFDAITSESRESVVTSLTDEQTDNHGAGIKITKTVDPSEFLGYTYSRLATKDLDDPVSLSDKVWASVEFWIKNEGRSQTAEVDGVETTSNFGISHFFINNEPVFAMMAGGTLGVFMKDYTDRLSYGDGNYSIPDGTWAKVKLDFKQGVKDVEGVSTPITKMVVNVMGEEGTTPETEVGQWRTYAERDLKLQHQSIDSISFGYSKNNDKPLVTDDLNIYVAGMDIYRNDPIADAGWYGYEDIGINETGIKGRKTTIGIGSDGADSAHPSYPVVSKYAYTTDVAWFNYVRIGTTELAEPVKISEDPTKPTSVEMWVKTQNLIGTNWADTVIFINDQPFVGFRPEGGFGYANFDHGWFTYLGANLGVADNEWIKFKMDFYQEDGKTIGKTFVKKNEADEWIPEGENVYGSPGTRRLNSQQQSINSISVGYRHDGDGSPPPGPSEDMIIKIAVDGLKIDGQAPHERFTISESGADLTAKYSLRAFEDTTKNVKVLVAAYDNDGNLMDVSLSEAGSLNFTGVNTVTGTAGSVTSTLTVPAGAASVRAYAWDSVSTLTPIFDSAPLTR